MCQRVGQASRVRGLVARVRLSDVRRKGNVRSRRIRGVVEVVDVRVGQQGRIREAGIDRLVSGGLERRTTLVAADELRAREIVTQSGRVRGCVLERAKTRDVLTQSPKDEERSV